MAGAGSDVAGSDVAGMDVAGMDVAGMDLAGDRADHAGDEFRGPAGAGRREAAHRVE